MNRSTREFSEVQGVKAGLAQGQTKQNHVINTNRLQRNKTFSVLRKMSVGALAILFASGLHAGPLSTINAYIGFAKTLKSIWGGIVGETTVTPACALARWDSYVYGIYGKREDGKPNYYGRHLQVTRNEFTGLFSYKTELRDQYTGRWYAVDRQQIDIPRLARMTYTCVPTPGGPFIHNTLEDFSLHVWAASVKKTGYFPPKEPYTAYMKCDAKSLQKNCTHVDFNPRDTKIRSTPIPLRDSGTVTVKMPIVQYEYAFPPLLWVGNWKDY